MSASLMIVRVLAVIIKWARNASGFGAVANVGVVGSARHIGQHSAGALMDVAIGGRVWGRGRHALSLLELRQDRHD